MFHGMSATMNITPELLTEAFAPSVRNSSHRLVDGSERFAFEPAAGGGRRWFARRWVAGVAVASVATMGALAVVRLPRSASLRVTEVAMGRCQATACDPTYGPEQGMRETDSAVRGGPSSLSA